MAWSSICSRRSATWRWLVARRWGQIPARRRPDRGHVVSTRRVRTGGERGRCRAGLLAATLRTGPVRAAPTCSLVGPVLIRRWFGRLTASYRRPGDAADPAHGRLRRSPRVGQLTESALGGCAATVLQVVVLAGKNCGPDGAAACPGRVVGRGGGVAMMRRLVSRTRGSLSRRSRERRRCGHLRSSFRRDPPAPALAQRRAGSTRATGEHADWSWSAPPGSRAPRRAGPRARSWATVGRLAPR